MTDGKAEPHRWFCLICSAQHLRRPSRLPGEPVTHSRAERILEARGFLTLMPVRTEARRLVRYRSRRVRRSDIPLLTGYLFARPGPGCEGLWRALSLPFVRGVICRPGTAEPATVPHSELRHVLDRCSAAPAAHEHMPTGREYQEGDLVTVLSGPFEGQTVRVERIDGAQAAFLTALFGGTVRASAPVSALAAIDAGD